MQSHQLKLLEDTLATQNTKLGAIRTANANNLMETDSDIDFFFGSEFDTARVNSLKEYLEVINKLILSSNSKNYLFS